MKFKIILSGITFIELFFMIFLGSCSKEIENTDTNTNSDPDPIHSAISRCYKEFIIEVKDGQKWRVTDPNTTYSGSSEEQPSKYLPNPVLEIPDVELRNAVRAEAIIDRWGGHTGTIGHQVRFNGNSWINLPIHLEGAPTNSEYYNFQDNPVIEVPLKHLKIGSNHVEGTSGPQTKFKGAWGQWGW